MIAWNLERPAIIVPAPTEYPDHWCFLQRDNGWTWAIGLHVAQLARSGKFAKPANRFQMK
jgi:hypothetical protein